MSYIVTGGSDDYTVNSNKYLNWDVSWRFYKVLFLLQFFHLVQQYRGQKFRSWWDGSGITVSRSYSWGWGCGFKNIFLFVLWWPQLHRWQMSSRKTCGLILWSISTMLVVLLWWMILFIYFIVLYYIFVFCAEISHCRS